MVNAFLGVLPEIAGEAITLERVLGFLLIPLTMMMGIPYEQAFIAGQLMGTKLVLTEFIAYVRLGELPLDVMSERTRIIMTYALCGFANFVSLGIMVSGLITLVPKRKQEIIDLGLKSLVAGTIATCTTAISWGLLLQFNEEAEPHQESSFRLKKSELVRMEPKITSRAHVKALPSEIRYKVLGAHSIPVPNCSI